MRTGRAGQLALVCGLVMIAGPLTASLVEHAMAARQPGYDVTVRQLAAGKLLVAARNLPDPNFADTVLLLLEYSQDGAAALVLNRPAGVGVSRVLPGLGSAADGTAPAYIGGPVSRDAVLALSRAACGGCRAVGGVHLVKATETLQHLLSKGADERRLRVYVGYAGWRGGQLEQEVRQGAWRVIAAEAPLVFDPDPASLWRRLIQRAEAVLALVGPRVSAPSARPDHSRP